MKNPLSRLRQRVSEQHPGRRDHDPHPAEVVAPRRNPELAAHDPFVVCVHFRRHVYVNRHEHQPRRGGDDARAVPGEKTNGALRAFHLRRPRRAEVRIARFPNPASLIAHTRPAKGRLLPPRIARP